MTAIRGYLGAGVVAISLLFLLGCATTGEMTQLENNIGELQADMAKTQSTLTALQTTLTGLDNRLQTIEEQATKQAMLSQEMEAIVEQFRVQLAKQEEVLANLRQEFTATLLHQQSTPTETPLSPQEPLTTRSAPPITAPASPSTVPASPPTAPTSSTTVSTPPLSSDELYRQAYEAFTAKEYEKAVDLFSTYVQNYPENDLADNSQYWIGESYYFLQNYQQALEAFQEVIAKYPLGNKVADALLKRGLTFVTLQEYEAALREFQKVIDRYPTSSVAQIARENITEIQKIR